MQPDIATGITAPFFANGIIGSICVALALFILKLWTEMKNERAAHKVELAAKDALIEKLYDARINEARVGFEIIKANERSLDAFVAAVNARKAS
ncbi:hypothetical protein [Rhizobium sp. 2MFCol3.1]|uniref:hypothetical protein n=1 Tax=Rhizobium sp. 2MFCol3.1 TaxID=1246459 RepID=UPI00037BEE76|nr:hypothetical protein [Rhizobium sp. 2MFCol3.1]